VRVAEVVRPTRPKEATPALRPPHRYSFDPATPDLAGFPRDRWLRSLRAAWRQAPIDAVGEPDPRGAAVLRLALAEYLGRVRGAAADPEQILVCTGFTQGLALISRWLAERGIDRLAVEDPGWHRHRLIAEQAGLEVAVVPVDGDGIDVAALERTGASAVVVTPAHQFPTGALLASERRAALVEWAERGDRLVIEDDYDAELRYDRSGVGALQGLAPERVAYIGSASKRLTPGMRLGWALLPSWLAWQIAPAKALADGGSEVAGQLALADFLQRGELDRHLRRMRGVYRSRREALLDSLGRHLPEARPRGGEAGLFELVELPEGAVEAVVVEAAARRGLGVEGLAVHSYSGTRPGLVLGFGAMAEPAIERGASLLADAVRV